MSTEVGDSTFKVLLDLMMCSDPWPMPYGRRTMEDFLDDLSRSRGYSDWIEAYHEFDKAMKTVLDAVRELP